MSARWCFNTLRNYTPLKQEGIAMDLPIVLTPFVITHLSNPALPICKWDCVLTPFVITHLSNKF